MTTATTDAYEGWALGFGGTVDHLTDALVRLQRPIQPNPRRPGQVFCSECGGSWPEGEPEQHTRTCATGIARDALARVANWE